MPRRRRPSSMNTIRRRLKIIVAFSAVSFPCFLRAAVVKSVSLAPALEMARSAPGFRAAVLEQIALVSSLSVQGGAVMTLSPIAPAPTLADPWRVEAARLVGALSAQPQVVALHRNELRAVLGDRGAGRLAEAAARLQTRAAGHPELVAQLENLRRGLDLNDTGAVQELIVRLNALFESLKSRPEVSSGGTVTACDPARNRKVRLDSWKPRPAEGDSAAAARQRALARVLKSVNADSRETLGRILDMNRVSAVYSSPNPSLTERAEARSLLTGIVEWAALEPGDSKRPVSAKAKMSMEAVWRGDMSPAVRHAREASVALVAHRTNLARIALSLKGMIQDTGPARGGVERREAQAARIARYYASINALLPRVRDEAKTSRFAQAYFSERLAARYPAYRLIGVNAWWGFALFGDPEGSQEAVLIGVNNEGVSRVQWGRIAELGWD